MKMELIEGSETSAVRTQIPGNYPKENILHSYVIFQGYVEMLCCVNETYVSLCLYV